MTDRIKRAHEFAMEAHKGQERKFTGAPYTKHLEETAQILWEITDGQATHDMYIAAILHDTVEDTDTTLEDIGKYFGKVVMDLVGELTINEKEKEVEGKKAYLARRLNEMSDDEALLIKLCDRFSNVSGLTEKEIPIKFVKWYIKETQYIISHLDRELTKEQKLGADKITQMVMFLKLDRNING